MSSFRSRVYGQGRIEAYKPPNQTSTPAIVIDATSQDCMVLSLPENLARGRHRGPDLLRNIEGLTVEAVTRSISPQELTRRLEPNKSPSTALLRSRSPFPIAARRGGKRSAASPPLLLDQLEHRAAVMVYVAAGRRHAVEIAGAVHCQPGIWGDAAATTAIRCAEAVEFFVGFGARYQADHCTLPVGAAAGGGDVEHAAGKDRRVFGIAAVRRFVLVGAGSKTPQGLVRPGGGDLESRAIVDRPAGIGG